MLQLSVETMENQILESDLERLWILQLSYSERQKFIIFINVRSEFNGVAKEQEKLTRKSSLEVLKKNKYNLKLKKVQVYVILSAWMPSS